jgi:hypothetical protein
MKYLKTISQGFSLSVEPTQSNLCRKVGSF